MNCTLTCYDLNGDVTVLSDCLGFTLLRERYQPFSSLNVKMRCGAMQTPVRVRFSLGTFLLMDGIVQNADVSLKGGLRILSVNARSFTAVLAKNQLEPGVHYDVTLDSLMQVYSLPHVTYQTGMQQVGYIYVKDHSPMWSAVAAYNYKLNGGFPYVRADNMLCVVPQAAQTPIVLPDTLFSSGTQNHQGSIVSKILMASIDGDYGRYEMDNPEAALREIVNVRQMAFDKQFIYNPEDALRYQIALSNRRIAAEAVSYPDYRGEDIGDSVTYGNKTAVVSRIQIHGDGKGVVTEDSFYFDSFCNTV